jgi:type III restriction enzyme
LPNPNQWQVTPETARLLRHWRHHEFSSVRPFFCQVEAVETAIWLTEVAPHTRNGKRLLDHLAIAARGAHRGRGEWRGRRRQSGNGNEDFLESSY